MNIKLRIDLHQGIIEVDGPEPLVRDVYSDFREAIKSRLTSHEPNTVRASSTTIAEPQGEKNDNQKQRNASTSRRRSTKRESFKLLDIDLSSLKEFAASKKAQRNFERNAIFIYYLKNIARIDNVTIDHVYTCYKALGIPVPRALQQSLRDTAERKGWIDVSNWSDLRITTIGENAVEHDLAADKNAQ